MSTQKRNRFRGDASPELLNDTIEVATAPDPDNHREPPPAKEKPPRKNRAKKDPVEISAKKEETAQISLKERFRQLTEVYRNERTQKIVGLLVLLASAYLTIAFISYFFTWQIDQDKVLGNTSDLFSPDTKV